MLSNRVRIHFIVALLSLAGYCTASIGWAMGDDIMDISLEELMSLDMEVTTVAKKSQKLKDAAAAVYVITQEDIRRSGHKELPELLRMVPGLNVARIDANKWAISARGFNDRFANKLLVLIDGRSVYNPLFSGVYWNVQDTVLADIDRIEVIRGPGSTLWGANAVNGVINIITKHASATQGILADIVKGTQEKQFAVGRYGDRISDSSWFRVYVKDFQQETFADSAYGEAHDAWNMLRGGFRFDSDLTHQDALTIQGDIYSGDADQTVRHTSLTAPYQSTYQDRISSKGGNLMMRWQHKPNEHSEWSVSGYVDRVERDEIINFQRFDTYNLELQNQLSLEGQHTAVWGLGYRYVDDEQRNSMNLIMDPEQKTSELWSVYLQGDAAITDAWRVIAGSKFEYNDYTGFEYQPTLRSTIRLSDNRTLWGAVSRAVHVPGRADSDIRLNVSSQPADPPLLPYPFLISQFGNKDPSSEELLAYELGLRSREGERFNWDVALFYNRYKNLLVTETGELTVEADPAPTHFLIPLYYRYQLEAESYGLELSSQWRPSENLELNGGYSYLHLDVSSVNEEDPAQFDRKKFIEERSPTHQLHVRAFYDMGADWELDGAAYYVDRLGYANNGERPVDAYVRLDLRLGWKPKRDLEFSLVGLNLLDDRHPEYSSDFLSVGTEVPRSVYLKMRFAW